MTYKPRDSAELAQIVANHTGFPWFNPSSYIGYRGWWALSVKAAKLSMALGLVIEELRSAKLYKHSDKLRDIKMEMDDALFWVRPDLMDGGKSVGQSGRTKGD